MHVADALVEAMERTGSIACVGLDPRPDSIPPEVAQAAIAEHGDSEEAVALAFERFNAAIIEAVAGHCAAVKPQSACYEAYGPAGWAALRATVRSAHEHGLVVIVDGKRGDVGSTTTHYRQALFGGAPGLAGATLPGEPCDWTTVNSYLGRDNVDEFLGAPGERGVFVLTHTSNPSSVDLQEVATEDGTVAEHLARLVDRWGSDRRGASGFSDIGAVVGATFPDQARRLRSLMPDTIFLVPGYGAQGADGVAAMAGADAGGRGVLVSASRSITAAWQKDDRDDWAAAARDALDRMNADLARARS